MGEAIQNVTNSQAFKIASSILVSLLFILLIVVVIRFIKWVMKGTKRL